MLTRLIRLIVGAVLAVPLLVMGAQAASAHAYLIGSTPASGTRVEQAPATIELHFSEAVKTDGNLTHLTTGDGAPIPTQLSVVGNNVVLTPNSTLPDGGYLLPWKAVSSEGHLIEGVVAFAIGNYAAPEGTESSSSDSGLNRWRQAGAWILILIAACAAFARKPLGWAFVGLIASALSVVRMFDLGARAGGWDTAWQIGEFKAAAIIAVAGVLLAIGRKFKPAAYLGIAVFALQPFVVGHSLDASPPWFFAALNAIHLAAAACWVGALVALLANPTDDQARITSKVSKISIIVLIIAALINAAALLGLPMSNWGTTSWTWLLGVKVLLVIAMLAVGLLNNRRIARGESATNLRTAVAAELVLVLGVAIVTATLVTQRPPILSDTASSSADPTPTPTASVVMGENQELVPFSGNWNVLVSHPPVAAGVPTEWALALPVTDGVQNVYATITRRETGAKGTYTGFSPTPALTWNGVLTFPTPGEYDVVFNVWRADGRVSQGTVPVTVP